MYKSFTVKNFRNFRDLTIEPLERVNLITGKNNVGKTALLEAFFLHMGPNNPALSMTVSGFRGIERLASDAEEVWGWLFFDKNIGETIELSSRNEENEQQLLRIYLVGSEEPQPILSSEGNSKPTEMVTSFTTETGPQELRLEYEDSAGKTSVSRMFFTLDGIEAQRAQILPVPRGIFLSTRTRFIQEEAKRFSKIERVGHIADLLPPLKVLEPRLRRLSLVIVGDMPIIHGDIGLKELVPIPLMGEGMVRLLSMLLAIYDAPDGVILLDEIENGLRYSVMADVWKAIDLASEYNNTQVLATTHSWECVVAAHQSFEAREKNDFRLHRLDWVNEDITAITYDWEALTTSVEMSLEVR
jgi:hypothetical protein